MKKPVEFNYCFSSGDVSAILAALPLVIAYGADTTVQNQINADLCALVAQKLINHASGIAPNEFRVMALSVILARDLLTGRIDLDIDEEHRNDLKQYLFSYNRLASVFEPVLEHLRNQQ